ASFTQTHLMGLREACEMRPVGASAVPRCARHGSLAPGRAFCLSALFIGWLVLPAWAILPAYDHVVIVVEENHSYSQIIGSSSAPYINNVLVAEGASFTKAYGEEHHSEGNYLWLFAGSNFGIGYGDPCPVGPFSSANLASELIAT